MKNIRLYLLRHGITQGNIDKKYIGGGTDEPLCKEGKAQLCELYEKFTYPKVEVVFASGLERCIQSADIMFPNVKNKLIIDSLQECNFGEFENKSFDELKSDENFKKWLTPGSGYIPKNGEDTGEFHKRCADTFLKLIEYMLKSNTAEAACVTHGGVIMSMLSQCALPKKLPESWMADPGCGYMVQCSTAMFMRDKAVEVTAVLPFGYLGDEIAEDDDEYFEPEVDDYDYMRDVMEDFTEDEL